MNKMIVALILLIVVVVVAFAVIFISVMMFPFNPASNVTPAPTGSQIKTPSPTPTSTPGQTLTPTPTPTTAGAVITIQHKGVTYSSLVDKYGLTDTPDAGNVWLVINMTLTNKGYNSFNTNPNYFTVTINNIKYSYDGETFSYGNWNTVDILNGGSFDGSLVFQVPSSTTSFTLNYNRFGVNYNIVYS